MTPLAEINIPLAAGRSLPVDHGYALYSALCLHSPVLHYTEETWMLAPVPGRQVSKRNRMMALPHPCSVRLRMPWRMAARVSRELAGAVVNVDHHLLKLGRPQLTNIKPARDLYAKMVVIRSMGRYRLDADEFTASLAKQILPLLAEPNRIQLKLGEKRTQRVNGATSEGYTVRLLNLSEADSVTVQCSRIGGRHHHGAGWFEQARAKENVCKRSA